ncbi:MAG: TIGR02757 family protein [Saprospiraceae bacterium]
MNKQKDLLDYYSEKYNNERFIETDPISIPHRFSRLQDIEIAGFWTAILSWGNRKSIINSGNKLMTLMGESPYQFMLEHKEKDKLVFKDFCHRTFNFTDSLYFLDFFQRFYLKNHSLEEAFIDDSFDQESGLDLYLEHFYNEFFSNTEQPFRTKKHISRPSSNSRCKRLIMFLRWMVRSDNKGVDFGIWKRISMKQLMIPLDVHVERTARKLELLNRTPLDWKAVVELTIACRNMNPEDPAIYDYALFGLSLENKIIL